MADQLNADEKRLAELGYKQDLDRSWSGFSNFAISFSIISILAGCFTNFGAGWNNGGPISISWSWPILSIFILIIGFTMSELVSAYPTSGGIYWWASKLGGPAAGFFTGWLNLIGLIAVTAGVSYGCATFIDLTISTYSDSYADDYSLKRVFVIFLVVLVLASVLNIFSSHLMAVMNNVSVWWHVVGATAIVLILILVPDQHQSFNYVFTERFNNSGFSDGSTSNFMFFFAIIPFGFLLTQYTITGFDACAHLSEETSSASTAAAKGIWRSIFYSALGGYILLLAVVFAVPDKEGVADNAGVGGGGVAFIFVESLGTNWATFVLFISASAQFYCATSCLTSASRMAFAFSRDGAVPGSRLWSSLSAKRVPANAVMGVAVAAALVTLPALIEVNVGTEAEPLIIPVAFYAVTSIAVIGLYASFAIPIWLRWRRGDAFEVGQWNNGAKYKWMNLLAVAEIVIVSIYLMMPFVPGAVPFSDDFSWKFVNYAPLVTIGAVLLLAIWWNVSAKKWFNGPISNIDPAVAELLDD
ncbi:MAG: amino acid/polyamine/organocation transporter, superfamily [Aeromicrobium sp.]|jgi:amino acid transporter|uniref:amino acid permease n=1 Tax=Aeromicrobium sp. TaxID=1871063 RepID=UPI002630E586|nr:amino acid permease [Aeromicrobium sp.]MCW2790263.1 amino acid/polyamine/organocation transporter, superfamily [Aeromicrobium sp.]MCW2824497.1 amino acid/polyamine/organocation transporter, superfamily [Aeromicrobium sp.]